MSIGEYINEIKTRLGYKNFADMAKVAGVPNSFLLRMSKIQSKSELKQENIENIENLSHYLNITIDEFINPISIDRRNINGKIKLLNNVDDVGIILEELIQIVDDENIKFKECLMNDKSKQIFKDSLDIMIELVKSKL